MNDIVRLIPVRMMENYFEMLIGAFFKILPIKESQEPSLAEYMRSLQLEIAGCEALYEGTDYDPLLLSLIAILQYLIDTECDVKIVKREVFKAISICKKIKNRHLGKEWSYEQHPGRI